MIVPNTLKVLQANITLFSILKTIQINISWQQKYFYFNVISKCEIFIEIRKPFVMMFPEDIEIAKFINTNSQPEDNIILIGSEPQIYFTQKKMLFTACLF